MIKKLKKKSRWEWKWLELMSIKKKMEKNKIKIKDNPRPPSKILPLYIFSRTADELSTIILLSIARCTALYIA